MSGAILQAELSGLIQESKRKRPEIRAAAEKSLSDLKSLHVTSEAQLAGDLLRKPSFADPFVLACKSRNAKLVTSGVICLQRLAASHALPSERLRDVLEAFREVTASGFDVQIKILQTLPSLFQTHASDIHGGLLFTSLEICGALQSSKTTVVSSTASATLQQLVSSAFEIIADEDETTDSDTTREVHVGSDTIVLKRAANDGFEIFGDLCDIADGADAQRLKPRTMSPVFALDLILTILLSNEKVFKTHIELLVVCRRKLMPVLIRRLSAKQTFPITIRSLRILYLLINHHFEYIQDESETALSLLIHFLDPEASQGWKRAVCMETLRNVIANFPLLRRIFYCFDMKAGRKDIVSKVMAALAKMAAEKPIIVGLSHRSTMPSRRTDDEKEGQDQTSLEAAGVDGVIGSTIVAESHITGISAVWSLPKNPCLEQLEKNDAPSLPDTYIYSLVLDCIYSLSEGLAKFVMPTSIARNERKKSQVQADEQLHESPEKYVGTDGSRIAQPVSATEPQKAIRLVNPLAVTSHPQSESTKIAADLVSSCWPAFLATCATFLNAALDAEFYHNLVRAIQKLAQVAGVLELSTPRDAFLTTLAKAAVPPQARTSGAITDARKAEISPTAQTTDNVASDIASPVNKLAPGMRISSNADVTILTTRNLLCMRALLHLGIALGPTFTQEAWCILLETLQEAEHLIKMSPRSLMNQTGKPAEDPSSTEPSSSGPNLGGEIAAVQTASKKMFASTSNYDKDVFLSLLKALLSLSASTEFVNDRRNVASPIDSSTFRRVGRMHQSSRSVSGSFFKLAAEDSEVLFVLSKTSEVAKSNLQRFVRQSAADSGWSLITDRLLQVLKSSTATSDIRLRAASLLDTMILGTLQNLDDEDERLQREVQHRDVSVLRSQIEGLYQESTVSVTEGRKTDLEIHERALETLVAIIEQRGENLLISWQTIFKLGGTIFEEQTPPFAIGTQQDVQKGDLRARSVKLIQIAFRLLQLVGSDFLNLLPMHDLLGFIELLLLFGRQHDDLNVSLTSTTFFWNLADFLHSSQTHHSLDYLADVPTEGFLVDQISSSHDTPRVVESLWLLLLLRLNTLTTDSRLEVRNGATRVTLRILDASGPSLSPRGWNICLSLILLRLLKSHASLLVKLQGKNPDDDLTSFDQWHASTVALLEGSINLVCHFFNEISADEHFYAFWEELFEVLGSILTTPSLAVSSTTFHGVTLLFSSLKNASYRDVLAASPALRLWSSCHPADTVADPELGAVPAKVHDSNQEAFTAHAESVIQITEALPSVRLDQIDVEKFMQALRKTILQCVHPPHGSDVQKMAPEQERVAAILQRLSATRMSKTIQYYETLFDFILVAFKDEADLGNDPRPELPAKQGSTSRSSHRPSFVAFASRCIDLLENDIIAVAQHGALAGEVPILCSALNVLSDATKAKYSAKAHRGDPLLWRKATASALAIVEAVSSHRYSMMDQEELLALNEVYGSAIEIAVGILGSGSLEKLDRVLEEDTVAADEEHDIAAFKRLSLSSIPALTKLKDPGARPNLTVEIHRRFVIELFRASLIAVPQYADLPSDKDLATSPLSSLLQVRAGTIKKLGYHVRSRMPYLALDTLFRLAIAFDGDKTQDAEAFADHMKLARIAAPYVLLRAAHTLKSFIADQPLRGPMSMPSKLRAEMLYILRSCLELRSEDEAFVGQPGSHACFGQDGRRHLRVLYPLVLRMWKVWRRVPRCGFSWITDEDGFGIEKCLHRWMELCGENWELADFNS